MTVRGGAVGDLGKGSVDPIVVAIDDDLAAGIVESLLKSAGYPVVRAERAGQLLTLATRHRAQVAILDLNSSHRTGLEVLRRLRSGEGRGLRVLALTVQTRAGLEDEARLAGADAFLTRPFDPADLIESVARLSRGAEEPVVHPPARIASFTPFTPFVRGPRPHVVEA
jgi:DNA-binding response OmpR family regulator